MSVFRLNKRFSLTHLVHSTEDVCIILLETTDSGKTRQGTRELVAVQHTEIGHPPWQVLVSDVRVGKDLAVSGAVHGLQAISLLLDVKGEHVLLVVTPVTRDLPQIRLVHVGGHDLGEATFSVLALEEIHQGIVDAHTVRQEEGGSRRHLVKEEELLVLANLSVVALGGLGQEVLILLELLLVGE
jgi:hypothetical protein